MTGVTNVPIRVGDDASRVRTGSTTTDAAVGWSSEAELGQPASSGANPRRPGVGDASGVVRVTPQRDLLPSLRARTLDRCPCDTVCSSRRRRAIFLSSLFRSGTRKIVIVPRVTPENATTAKSARPPSSNQTRMSCLPVALTLSAEPHSARPGSGVIRERRHRRIRPSSRVSVGMPITKP